MPRFGGPCPTEQVDSHDHGQRDNQERVSVTGNPPVFVVIGAG